MEKLENNYNGAYNSDVIYFGGNFLRDTRMPWIFLIMSVVLMTALCLVRWLVITLLLVLCISILFIRSILFRN